MQNIKKHSQRWWQLAIGFEYTPEWYDNYYRQQYINKTKSAQILEESYCHDGDNNLRRFRNVYLSGKGLELGFSNGRSLYYLGKKYKNIIMDGIDWVPSLIKIIPFIKELSLCVDELTIDNIKAINKPDNCYDFITSLDTFEHLNEETYFACINECYRVLKPDGSFFVYIGKPDNASHINRRPDKQAIKEISNAGFIFVKRRPDNNNGLLIFRK